MKENFVRDFSAVDKIEGRLWKLLMVLGFPLFLFGVTVSWLIARKKYKVSWLEVAKIGWGVPENL